MNNKGNFWSEKEIEYLRNNYYRRTPFQMAQRLGRTPTAIQIKIKRLGLHSYLVSNFDYISVLTFARMIGVTETTVYDWINKYSDFPVEYKRVYNRIHKLIIFEKILEWLRKHQDLFNATNVEKFTFSEEPSWLIEKRRNDIKKQVHKPRCYTVKEQDKIWILFCKGESCDDIAKKFNRHPQSIRNKITELKKKGWKMINE